jgi:hypothetical protein
MPLKERPYYTIPAVALAEWIDNQPDKWWSVDGDPLLSSMVDFPCPSDELAPVIRRVGKDLLLRDMNTTSQAHGEAIGKDNLDELCVRSPRRGQKILCLSWADSGIDWLLLEDEAMVSN